MSSPEQKNATAPVEELAQRGGVLVTHEGPGKPIQVFGWRNGERRSLVVSQARALGLIQQLARAAANDDFLRLWHEDGKELGTVGPQHALTLIRDLAAAVRSNRAQAVREAQQP